MSEFEPIEGHEVVLSNAETQSLSRNAFLGWARSQGIDPEEVPRWAFVVTRDADGQLWANFREYIYDDTGCLVIAPTGDTYAKTEWQQRPVSHLPLSLDEVALVDQSWAEFHAGVVAGYEADLAKARGVGERLRATLRGLTRAARGGAPSDDGGVR